LFLFFSYFGEGFFILYKESEENREIRNVRLVGNTEDSSILLGGSLKSIRLYWQTNKFNFSIHYSLIALLDINISFSTIKV